MPCTFSTTRIAPSGWKRCCGSFDMTTASELRSLRASIRSWPMALNDWNHSAPDADSWPEEYEDDGKLEGEALAVYQVKNLVDNIHVAARTADMYTGIGFAPCARCGRYYKLLKVVSKDGKGWYPAQPEHSCGDEF